jgi:hypothetical protein
LWTLPTDSYQADTLGNSVSMRIDTASLSVPGKKTLDPFGWCGDRIVINQFTTATFMNYTCEPAFQSGLLKNPCHLTNITGGIPWAAEIIYGCAGVGGGGNYLPVPMTMNHP